MAESEHKTYGESKLEIPYGWYSTSEIEEMLETIKINENMNKKMFERNNMSNSIFDDVYNQTTLMNNLLIAIKASDYPHIPIRLLGRVWNDFTALRSKLELLMLLDASEHIEQYDIEKGS